MNPAAAATRNYLDFSGFSALRAEARANSPEAIKEVASQFEAMFINMALRAMRDATFASGLLDNEQSKLYQGLLDQQLSLTLSERGLGLAGAIERQLNNHAGAATPTPTLAMAAPSRAKGVSQAVLETIELARRRPLEQPAVSEASDPAVNIAASQEAFVEVLAPLARRAARELGVDHRAILAQVALETGWGKHVLADRLGRSTHNLFGIKADSSWTGNRVNAPTREHDGQDMTATHASFRAYDSFADSFNDYVRFLQDNPRYRPALDSAGDGTAFVDALQRAGFATDPLYADKIKQIMDSEVLRSTGSGGVAGAGLNTGWRVTPASGSNGGR